MESGAVTDFRGTGVFECGYSKHFEHKIATMNDYFPYKSRWFSLHELGELLIQFSNVLAYGYISDYRTPGAATGERQYIAYVIIRPV